MRGRAAGKGSADSFKVPPRIMTIAADKKGAAASGSLQALSSCPSRTWRDMRARPFN
jgi:hypothetical protein